MSTEWAKPFLRAEPETFVRKSKVKGLRDNKWVTHAEGKELAKEAAMAYGKERDKQNPRLK